ncbi:MAG: YybH family protein [Methyloligella sp. ZOD6]
MSRLKALMAVTLLVCLTMLAPQFAAAKGLKDPKEAAMIFVQATARGDAAAIAELYAPKATLLLPDGKVAEGRAEIRDLTERMLRSGDNDLVIRDMKIDGDDSRAVMIWSWVRQITPKEGDPITIRGRSMLYWLKSEEGWQIAVDMYQQVPSR